VHALTALGELAVLENDDKLAIERIGQALQITKTWNLGDEDQALRLLAPVLERLGENQFQTVWAAFGFGNAPLDDLRAMQ
jgi:hypothetical protein